MTQRSFLWGAASAMPEQLSQPEQSYSAQAYSAVDLERRGKSRELAEDVRRAICKHTKFYAWEAWGNAWRAGVRVEGRSADEPDYFITITPVRPAGRRQREKERST